MSYFICDNCEKKHYIFRQGGGNRISQSLGVPFLGEIPLEPEVAVGGDVGLPIVEKNPGSASARAYREIAGLIAQELSILSVAQTGVLGEFDYTWDSLPSSPIAKTSSITATLTPTPSTSTVNKSPLNKLATVSAPVGLFRKEPDILSIHWNDGSISDFKSRFLRSSCPCAECVNEWTGEKMLDEARLPSNIKPGRIVAVGRYAMAIHWSDGHKTGIYSYDYLKKLGAGNLSSI